VAPDAPRGVGISQRGRCEALVCLSERRLREAHPPRARRERYGSRGRRLDDCGHRLCPKCGQGDGGDPWQHGRELSGEGHSRMHRAPSLTSISIHTGRTGPVQKRSSPDRSHNPGSETDTRVERGKSTRSVRRGGNERRAHGDPKRARSWKRWIQPWRV
jgi:hypothetical protein